MPFDSIECLNTYVSGQSLEVRRNRAEPDVWLLRRGSESATV